MRSVARDRDCANIHWPRACDQLRVLPVPKLMPGEIRLWGADKIGGVA